MSIEDIVDDAKRVGGTEALLKDYQTRPVQQGSVFAPPGVTRISVHNGHCFLKIGDLFTLSFRWPYGHPKHDDDPVYVTWLELRRLMHDLEEIMETKGSDRDAG